MPPITNDWADYLKEEYKKPYYRKLYQKVMDEYHTKLIFPPADDIFNAFHFTPVKDVKVVILGQDPYHGDGSEEKYYNKSRLRNFAFRSSHFIPFAVICASKNRLYVRRSDSHERTCNQRWQLLSEVSAPEPRDRRSAGQGPVRAYRHRRQVHL